METIEEQIKAETAETNMCPSPKEPVESTRICFVGDTVNDAELEQAALEFNVPVIVSETGLETLNDANCRTYYILNEFEGPIYEEIHRSKQHILGPPALKYFASIKSGLPNNSRPLYNTSMRGVVTCFTGIRKKEQLTKLVKLIHSMGGVIRKEKNSKMTHLISTYASGEKYQYAKLFSLTVVRPDWVLAAWERRNEAKFKATSDEFQNLHKLQTFEGQKICFYGFPPEEHQHMVDVLKSNGGTPVEMDDPECSHIVVFERNKKMIGNRSETYILRSDWFWYTIQNGYANEEEFQFSDLLNIASTPDVNRRDLLPLSLNKRKRKRLSQRLYHDDTPSNTGKRRSSISEAGIFSASNSMFDCTGNSEKLENTKLLNDTQISICEPNVTPVKRSMRFNHFMDFYSTESNYVAMLDTIVKLFKSPLEELAETNDALLTKSEIKTIFSDFLPIHEVHQRMLEKLRVIQCNWSEDCLIGDIILEHRDELIKAYPPYINFFEQMKEALHHCDTQNPRFHAFLKINQAKPECGRQSLEDLMIRPVQRLPSISLLIADILKHTDKDNPDHNRLDNALKAIKEVMTYINEDKRKTECLLNMFEIFNDIDGCPPHLVSSNRNYINKCEVNELSDNLSGRGDILVFYLFSDTLELCKKRSRATNSGKSPGGAKNCKHVKLIPLNAIRFVIDITDSTRAFALLCRHDDREKLYSFNMADEHFNKEKYLRILCKQMAENACHTDTEKQLLSHTSQELDVDLSDVNVSTLTKAFKLAAKTRMKVGRAFSLHKTPSKLKRSVSIKMNSPKSSSTSALTPATQLAQMRLASCTNVHEIDNDSVRTASDTDDAEVMESMPSQDHRSPSPNARDI